MLVRVVNSWFFGFFVVSVIFVFFDFFWVIDLRFLLLCFRGFFGDFFY
jgi:hypothetical protein